MSDGEWGDPRQLERSFFKSLVPQRPSVLVPVKNLEPVPAASAEQEQVPIHGISIRDGLRQLRHSRYSGRPHLCRLLPGWQEIHVKLVEAVLVLCIGFAIHLLNRPLGDYLMLAGVFVLVRGYCVASALRERAVELNDAVIEQREIAENFRQMQED